MDTQSTIILGSSVGLGLASSPIFLQQNYLTADHIKPYVHTATLFQQLLPGLHFFSLFIHKYTACLWLWVQSYTSWQTPSLTNILWSGAPVVSGDAFSMCGSGMTRGFNEPGDPVSTIFKPKEALWTSQWQENAWVWLLSEQTWLRLGMPSGLCWLLSDYLCGSPPPPPPSTEFSSPSITTPTGLSLQSHNSTCNSSSSARKFLPRISSLRISSILWLLWPLTPPLRVRVCSLFRLQRELLLRFPR